MKNALWISLPLSLLCLFAQANTITVATSAPPAATTPGAAPTAPPGASDTSAINTSVAAKPTDKKEEAPSIKYSLTLGAEYGMQAQEQDEGARDQSVTYTFKPGISYGEYTMKLEEYFEQNLVDSQSTNSESWTDPVLSMSKKAWVLNDYVKVGPSGSLLLPVKDSTRNNGTLYSANAALSFSLNTKTLGMDAWSFGYQILAGKTFTKFDTNAKGDPSPDHKFRNRLTFGYQFTDKFSYFNLFDFTSSYSVNGVVTNGFSSLQSFGYDITDNISVSLSHSNSGPYLKKDTYENNLKLYDEAGSSYSLGLDVSI